MSSKQHLEHKRQALQQQYDLLAEKLKRLRRDSATKTGTSVLFELEQDILQTESKLDELAQQLEKIERALSNGRVRAFWIPKNRENSFLPDKNISQLNSDSHIFRRIPILATLAVIATIVLTGIAINFYDEIISVINYPEKPETSLSENPEIQKNTPHSDYRFSCKVINQIPTTVAITARGERNLIRWKSQYFSSVGLTPDERCREVSSRLNNLIVTKRNIYLTHGVMNGNPVICTTSFEGGGCKELLFTLDPSQKPETVVKDLLNLTGSNFAGFLPLEQ